MTSTDNSRFLPPRELNDAGKPRLVGVELEFSGLPLSAIAGMVADQFCGTIEPISDYECLITGTSVGDFRVEVDYQTLKDMGREAPDVKGLMGGVRRLSEDALAELARHVVPMEVVTPPLHPGKFQQLDALVAELRAAGAKGTRHSAVYAFGLHLNPEVPSLDAEVLLRYLRAFVCLFDWLSATEEVDWSRRITPYINPYPREYIDTVLASGYRPDRTQLIDDYLALNAQRNRALDLLPLFAHIDEERVRASINDPRIKPRPTFHYRLPNCDVDRPQWQSSLPWMNWLAVERLAEDQERLDAACADFREHLASGLSRLTRNWAEQSRTWAQ